MPLGNPAATDAPAAPSFGAALRFWLKLGFISFGGPTGQISTMHAELVERRRWISEGRFLHALNYCMLLPGPEAQQLATYIGWLLHGTLGGVVAGVLFVFPSLFLLGALSWVYVVWGNLPAVVGVLEGFRPAVVALVLAALVRIASRSLRGPLLPLVALAALAGTAWGGIPFPAIVAGAGMLGAILYRARPTLLSGGPPEEGKGAAAHGPSVVDDATPTPRHAARSPARLLRTLLGGIALGLVPSLLIGSFLGWQSVPSRMAIFFTQAALVTFGGAYAVLPYVRHAAVEKHGWLREGEMMDGLALGETTPGPLIMVVAFVGFVGGWRSDPGWGGPLGALVATWFTFLPSILFILLGAPTIERTRHVPALHAPLAAITAAVVGVIANLALLFGKHALFEARGGFDAPAAALAALSFIGLHRFRCNVIAVVVGCGLLGLLRALVSR